MALDQMNVDEEKEMSFLDHLEELRWHVVRSVVAIMVFMVAAFFFTPWIFQNIIFAPAHVEFITFKWMCQIGHFTGSVDALCVKEIPFKVQSRYMTGQFTMQFMSAFVIGLIVAFPYVVWELWSFVRPGLRRKEQKGSKGAVAAVSFLFASGISFGYFILCPLMVWVFSTYSISPEITNEFDITSYVQTIVALTFGSGLLFQLPVVVFFLTKIGILTPQFMRTYRKHAVIIILIVAAIITPPDPLSQTIISIPLYLLYEISIFICAIEVKNKKKREEAEELAERQAT
ncbi:MAG TPA: twin-arginine translocase subunit TatC [Cyclobacteriaceae bacterium]